MRTYLLATLPMMMLGCAGEPIPSAVCDGTLDQRQQHAAALVEDGAPRAQSTGRTLIALVEAACTKSVSALAVCDGTIKARADHAAALVFDRGNGVGSRATGRTLIALIDDYCKGR